MWPERGGGRKVYMKRAAIPWNFQAVTLSSPGRNFTQFPSKDDDGDLDDEVLLHGVHSLKKLKAPPTVPDRPGLVNVVHFAPRA